MQGNKQHETLGTVTRSVGNLGLSWLWIEKRTLIGLRETKQFIYSRSWKIQRKSGLKRDSGAQEKSSGQYFPGLRSVFPCICFIFGCHLVTTITSRSLSPVHIQCQRRDRFLLESPALVLWFILIGPTWARCCLFTHPCGSGWHLLPFGN